MRASTVLNRLLAIRGAKATAVRFTADGVVVTIQRRAMRHRCPCGRRVAGRYDRTVRRWRHLDLGRTKVWLEAEICRVWCPDCSKVRTELVPWARPGARHTHAFEQVVAWLAQRMDKTSLAELMRCSWMAVHRIVTGVVTEYLKVDRLGGLRRIGVDEISYRRGHQYLTVVADHDTGRVVWVGVGRTAVTLGEFYERLGPQRCARLVAVTMDGGPAFAQATRKHAPQAEICYDGFHVIKWATETLDAVFRASQLPALKARMKAARNNKPWHKARNALRGAQQNLTPAHKAILDEIHTERVELYEAWVLKEELRDLYRIIAPQHAANYVRDWIGRARASGIRQMVMLGERIAAHYQGIVAAVEHRLSNGRLEGINTKIRVIQRRGYGHPNPHSLAAMIYLCSAGITIDLPTGT